MRARIRDVTSVSHDQTNSLVTPGFICQRRMRTEGQRANDIHRTKWVILGRGLVQPLTLVDRA